ncbi:hypothetical protein BDP55DRAFT_635741 [Colletotrichum godetiae]|uniref:Uncharacterized protein n=1 Tax=Colletotrichum godetiae TaxID=1209918 RepID=A0AAJ0EQC7_9PEZI|nr:uncharacterized protein BDP55DRAFT_635741 [Colletotrichum godetiae]KAK1671482.1 hypothetical protein BDP55DRAFT_635741 [Colletotrichum godetiae]
MAPGHGHRRLSWPSLPSCHAPPVPFSPWVRPVPHRSVLRTYLLKRQARSHTTPHTCALNLEYREQDQQRRERDQEALEAQEEAQEDERGSRGRGTGRQEAQGQVKAKAAAAAAAAVFASYLKSWTDYPYECFATFPSWRPSQRMLPANHNQLVKPPGYLTVPNPPFPRAFSISATSHTLGYIRKLRRRVPHTRNPFTALKAESRFRPPQADQTPDLCKSELIHFGLHPPKRRAAPPTNRRHLQGQPPREHRLIQLPVEVAVPPFYCSSLLRTPYTLSLRSKEYIRSNRAYGYKDSFDLFPLPLGSLVGIPLPSPGYGIQIPVSEDVQTLTPFRCRLPSCQQRRVEEGWKGTSNPHSAALRFASNPSDLHTLQGLNDYDWSAGLPPRVSESQSRFRPASLQPQKPGHYYQATRREKSWEGANTGNRCTGDCTVFVEDHGPPHTDHILFVAHAQPLRPRFRPSCDPLATLTGNDTLARDAQLQFTSFVYDTRSSSTPRLAEQPYTA